MVILSFLWECYRKEKGFVWAGLVGILLGLMAVFFFLLHGNDIPPEGKWTKVITFDLGIGIFSLTTAIVAPLIKMTARQRKWFNYTLITSIWVGYAIETVQNARGFDPRFTKVGMIWDHLAAMVFGVICILLAGCIVFALIRLFREKIGTDRYNLSLRYAFLSNLLGVLSGVWMILIQGRVTGDGVDIMALHFIGFHGYQAVPMIAWLLNQRQDSIDQMQKAVHLAGWSWLSLYFFLLLHFVFGHSIVQMTFYSFAGAISLIIYGLVALYSLHQWVRTKKAIV